MEDYIKEQSVDYVQQFNTSFQNFLDEKINHVAKMAAHYRAAGLVCEITGANSDGSYECTTTDGQTYSNISSATSTSYAVGAWVTMEYAACCYQIVGYGAYAGGAPALTATLPGNGTSTNGGASNAYGSS